MYSRIFLILKTPLSSATTATMVNIDTLRTAIGIIGNVISFGLFLSPFPTYLKIMKRKDVQDFSPNPYLATLMNCAMWVFYGIIHPHSMLVWTINAVGLLCEAVYIGIYLYHANSRKKRVYVFRALAVELLAIAAIVVSVSLFGHSEKQRSMIVGIICVVFNILMYGMPLDNCWTVWRTKSVEYMPFWLLVANFCNGLIWVSYACFRFDYNLVISNGSGVLLGLLQLVLYFVVSYMYPQEKKSKQS